MPHRRASDNASFQTKRPFMKGTTWMPRLLAGPSPKALRRLEVLDWHRSHGAVVRLTAPHFGYSPDTISRWARAFTDHRLVDLEDRSRRPRKVRTPTTPSAVVIRIRQLREQYPHWGREKIRVLLAREGITISAKTIDRTMRRLRARGELREPQVVRRAQQLRLKTRARPRRPGDFVVDRPSYLQIDTQELRRDGPFTFAAIDHLTRKRVVVAACRNTTTESARFLQRVTQVFPFPVWAVQTDGGSEYMGEFALTPHRLLGSPST